MSIRLQQGFTIIEISLFVAISGLLAIVLLGGWSLTINSQRYKDSVDTLQSYIQQQYDLVYNVENGRDNSLDCTTDSKVQDGSTPRGQSNCVVLGRYVRLSNGKDFTSSAVVGYEPDRLDASSDNEMLKKYKPRVVTQQINLSENALTIPWQAVAVRQGGDAALDLAIVILRSPSSGIVHTYIVPGSDNNLATVPDAGNETAQFFCVKPDSIVQGGRQAVFIPKYAASANAIETRGEGNGC